VTSRSARNQSTGAVAGAVAAKLEARGRATRTVPRHARCASTSSAGRRDDRGERTAPVTVRPKPEVLPIARWPHLQKPGQCVAPGISWRSSSSYAPNMSSFERVLSAGHWSCIARAHRPSSLLAVARIRAHDHVAAWARPRVSRRGCTPRCGVVVRGTHDTAESGRRSAHDRVGRSCDGGGLRCEVSQRLRRQHRSVRPRRRRRRCHASVLGDPTMPGLPSRSRTGAGEAHGTDHERPGAGFTHRSPSGPRKAASPQRDHRRRAGVQGWSFIMIGLAERRSSSP